MLLLSLIDGLAHVQIIRNKLPKGSLPSLEEYQAAVAARQQAKAADSQQPLLMSSLQRRTVHL